MTMIHQGQVASDRVMATLIAGLELEFGRAPGEGLARQFLDAEDVDFRWEARVEERWLGAYEGSDDDNFWLDRVAISGRLDGRWFTATMIVDGEGMAHGMLGCRTLGDRKAAHQAMMEAR